MSRTHIGTAQVEGRARIDRHLKPAGRNPTKTDTSTPEAFHRKAKQDFEAVAGSRRYPFGRKSQISIRQRLVLMLRGMFSRVD
jgi:hypothetical protein